MKTLFRRRFLLASLILLPLAGCAGEINAPQSFGAEAQPLAAHDRQSNQRLVKLRVTSEDGNVADVLLPEHGSLKFVNDRLGLSYRVTGQFISDDRVVMLVEQFNDKDLRILNATDVVELRAGEESRQRSAITQFSMRMTGVTTNAKLLADAGYVSCCVRCGDWIICCSAAPGYCCSIRTSCGNGCTACNP